MSREFNLNELGTWTEFYNQVLTDDAVHPYYGTPMISDTIVPTSVTSSIIAYKCLIPNKPPTWRVGGRLRRMFEGAILGSNTSLLENRTYTMYLEDINLIIFDSITQSFKIHLSIPHWIPQVQIVLWQYTGNDDGTQSDILDILIDKSDEILALLAPMP